jgi:hypothetical protein
MVVVVKRYLIATIVFILGTSVYGQGVFSTVTVNKSEVYLGEAIEMTVAVYTPTWFTKGVDIGNIKVNGAFSVYFRSVSTSRKINGQTYAGVQLIYNLFPYEQADVVIPPLTFEVESPKVGGYKGIRRKVTTQEKTVRLKPLPVDVERDRWMVTTNFRVREQWSRDLKALKVGDVVQRTITRNASNTVGELLPPLLEDSIPGVSQYPDRPQVNTNKSKTSISASRVDAISYLFEEAGEVSLPALEFIWWNPWQKKFLKRTLPEIKIAIAPNPDLGIVKSIKATLEAKKQEADEIDTDQPPAAFLGLDWKQWMAIIVFALVLTYVLTRFFKWWIPFLRRKKAAHRESEQYAFSQFVKAAKRGGSAKAIEALYKWLGKLDLPQPTLQAFADKVNDPRLTDEINRINKAFNKGENLQIKLEVHHWKTSRKLYFSKISGRQDSALWINPN